MASEIGSGRVCSFKEEKISVAEVKFVEVGSSTRVRSSQRVV